MIHLQIDNDILKRENWYVAYSGGPDSACLLHLLITKRDVILKKYNIQVNLTALHINHNLRPEESKQEQLFCERYCKQNNVGFIAFDLDVNAYADSHKKTIEQAAREMRYEVFDKYDTGWVFLGHNKDDDAETIFMNILRGSGLQGLKGIQQHSRHYVRPLLSYTKEQILEYNELNAVPYVVDSSNLEQDYMRNFIRNSIFPLLNERLEKDISNNLISLSQTAQQAQSFIDKFVQEAFNSYVMDKDSGIYVNTADFNELDEIVKASMLRKVIYKLKGNLINIEKKHIEQILELISMQKSGKQLHLPEGIRVLMLQNKRIKFYIDSMQELSNVKSDNNKVEINIPGITWLKEDSLQVIAEYVIYDEYMARNNKITDNVIYIHGELPGPLVFRYRQPGDTIRPKGMKGSKSLKKYFIDNKVDKDKRDSAFVLAVENEIVYIENMQIGRDFLPKIQQKCIRLEFI